MSHSLLFIYILEIKPMDFQTFLMQLPWKTVDLQVTHSPAREETALGLA